MYVCVCLCVEGEAFVKEKLCMYVCAYVKGEAFVEEKLGYVE